MPLVSPVLACGGLGLPSLLLLIKLLLQSQHYINSYLIFLKTQGNYFIFNFFFSFHWVVLPLKSESGAETGP